MNVDLHACPRVLRLTGEFTGATASRLGALLDWLVRDGQDRVVVDVSGVTLVDAAGVEPLLAVQRSAVGRPGVVELRGDAPSLQMLQRALEDAAAARPTRGPAAVRRGRGPRA